MAAGSRGLFRFSVNMLKIFLNPFIEQLKVGVLFKAQFETKVSNLSQQQQLCSGDVKNLDFHTFSREIMFLAERFCNWLCPLKLFFFLLKAKYLIQIVVIPNFKLHPPMAKAFSFQEHIYKHIKHHIKQKIFGIKVGKLQVTFSLWNKKNPEKR